MGNIYIFSDAIDSGKTAALESWLPKIQGAAGFLTPDVFGKRKLYDIATGDYMDLEVDETHPDHTMFGERAFDKNVFRYGQELLRKAADQWPRWLIIDQVTQLEIGQNGGWEPALSEVINLHNDVDSECDLLLVVNSELLDAAIQHYKLHTAIVLDKKFFLR